jgi:DHA2 family multidrug resistance protein-like MFS transporter
VAMIPGMAAATLGFMVVTPYLAARIRPAYIIAAGMLGTSAVLAVFTHIGATSGTATLVIGFAIFSFCGSPLVALGTNLIVGSAPPEQAGSAGSMAQMSNEFGGTMGNALLGTIGFAVYRHMVAGSLPAALPAHAAAEARDSIAGASLASSQVPHALGTALLTPADHAFTSGLHSVAAIGAVTLAGVAILIATQLRQLPPIGKAAPAGDAAETDSLRPASPVAQGGGAAAQDARGAAPRAGRDEIPPRMAADKPLEAE